MSIKIQTKNDKFNSENSSNLLIMCILAEEIDFKIGHFRSFQPSMTLTLILDHTVLYHSSTSIDKPNFVETGKNLWTDGQIQRLASWPNNNNNKNNAVLVTVVSRKTQAVKACCTSIGEVATWLVRSLVAGGVVLAWWWLTLVNIELTVHTCVASMADTRVVLQ